MTDLAAMLRELSEPWPSGDRIKAAIDRAARQAGLSYWRAFDIWYGKARSIDPDERARIAAALDERRGGAVQHELNELRNHLARLEDLLGRSSEDVSRPAAHSRRAG